MNEIIEQKLTVQHWMPGTQIPAPSIMTGDQVIAFLQLRGKNPRRTLTYWRMRGLLKAVPVTRDFRYKLTDVLDLVDELAKRADHPDLKPASAAFGTKRRRRKPDETQA